MSYFAHSARRPLMEFLPLKSPTASCGRKFHAKSSKRVIVVYMAHSMLEHALGQSQRKSPRPTDNSHLCGLSKRGYPTHSAEYVYSPYRAFSQFAAVNNDLRCLRRSKLFATPRRLAIGPLAERRLRSPGYSRKSLAKLSSTLENIGSASETG
jgi:hypothetical protein